MFVDSHAHLDGERFDSDREKEIARAREAGGQAIVAIGNGDVQKEVFTRQMELAAAAKLPIVIHCRPSEASEDAWDDCLGLMREHWVTKGLGGILHCFTGNWAQAKLAL